MCLDKVNKNNLHIGCWNINGHKHKGFDKYSDQRFINEIKEKDIMSYGNPLFFRKLADARGV